jgi:hypothetical protein
MPYSVKSLCSVKKNSRAHAFVLKSKMVTIYWNYCSQGLHHVHKNLFPIQILSVKAQISDLFLIKPKLGQ